MLTSFWAFSFRIFEEAEEGEEEEDEKKKRSDKQHYLSDMERENLREEISSWKVAGGTWVVFRANGTGTSDEAAFSDREKRWMTRV